jgi:hypothetical protein
MLENNRIEYKRELNDRFERSVVSFLNYADGDEIVLGIDNSGKITGISNPDVTQLKNVDRIKNNNFILPKQHLYSVLYHSYKNILVCT